MWWHFCNGFCSFVCENNAMNPDDLQQIFVSFFTLRLTTYIINSKCYFRPGTFKIEVNREGLRDNSQLSVLFPFALTLNSLFALLMFVCRMTSKCINYGWTEYIWYILKCICRITITKSPHRNMWVALGETATTHAFICVFRFNFFYFFAFIQFRWNIQYIYFYVASNIRFGFYIDDILFLSSAFVCKPKTMAEEDRVIEFNNVD